MEVKPAQPWAPEQLHYYSFLKCILKQPSASKSRGTEQHLCGEEGRFSVPLQRGPIPWGDHGAGIKKTGLSSAPGVLPRCAEGPWVGHFTSDV